MKDIQRNLPGQAHMTRDESVVDSTPGVTAPDESPCAGAALDIPPVGDKPPPNKTSKEHKEHKQTKMT